MNDLREFFAREFSDPEARRQYAEELLDSYIALQIKTLRLERGWTQRELADRAGKRQSQISAMEQTDFSSWKVSTLRKLADAFDLALVVRFESFGNFLHEALDVSRSALERPSYEDDPIIKPHVQAHESTDVTRTVTTGNLYEFPRQPGMQVVAAAGETKVAVRR